MLLPMGCCVVLPVLLNVSKQMNSKNIQIDTAMDVDDIAPENNGSKLLKFDENNTVTTGKDINNKITSLDTDLAQLRAKLLTINNSVEQGLDRLGDTDTDLTAKVSETYKRLGEIDNAYKALLEISSRIDTDIQKINGDVSNVAQQSASGIKNLEQSTIAQSNEFTQKNQQVASRVNQLVEASKLTSELLSQNIQSTTDKMLLIEKNVVAQIDNLSSATKDKTASIENSVDRNKAKILKLQSIDEAIIRRATTLEISSAELTVKSDHLGSSVQQLQISSENLSNGLGELKERTKELEILTNSHGAFIDGLQKVTADITDKLTALSGRERKHFNIVSAGFLMLLVVTAVIYFAQQNQFSIGDTRFADLQQMQTNAKVSTGNSLAMLENKVERMNLTIQDQVQSVEGRLNQTSPFSRIGSDNIIHGVQWIAGLPQENFAVQLSYAESKDALYKIAQRYNYYLKDSLSYFEINDNGITKYVLLSGNYTTQQQAIAARESLPRYIDMQQPVIRNLGVVQKYIAK